MSAISKRLPQANPLARRSHEVGNQDPGTHDLSPHFGDGVTCTGEVYHSDSERGPRRRVEEVVGRVGGLRRHGV